MRWHAADSNGHRREMGELACIEDRGKKTKKKSAPETGAHLIW